MDQVQRFNSPLSLGLESRGLGPGPAAALLCSSGPGTTPGFSSGLAAPGSLSGAAGPGCSYGTTGLGCSSGRESCEQQIYRFIQLKPSSSVRFSQQESRLSYKKVAMKNRMSSGFLVTLTLMIKLKKFDTFIAFKNIKNCIVLIQIYFYKTFRKLFNSGYFYNL